MLPKKRKTIAIKSNKNLEKPEFWRAYLRSPIEAPFEVLTPREKEAQLLRESRKKFMMMQNNRKKLKLLKTSNL